MVLRTRRKDPVAVKLERAGLAPEVARRLAAAGTLLPFAPSRTLCRVGELGTEAFVLVEGEAVVQLPDRDVHVEAGAVIGEMAVLDRLQRRSATVVTTAPASVLVFDVRTFRSLAGDGLADVLSPPRAA